MNQPEPDAATISDIGKGLIGPLELSRLHEAELKRCYKQYGLLGALIRQIMVGRWISLGGYPAQHAQVTDIKLKDGRPQVYGKLRGTRRPRLLCESLGGVTIVEGAKP